MRYSFNTMSKTLILIVLAVSSCLSNACRTLSVTTVTGTFADAITKGTLCAGDLIFEETFDQFNLEKWQHEITLTGGGNGEFEYYTNNRTNSFVKGGNLHIRPTFLADEIGEHGLYSATLDLGGGAPADSCTDSRSNGCRKTGTNSLILNPIKSAKIRTVDSFNFKYGKVEVNAKIPSGDWLWPAIWLMPRYNQYGGWPASGEIDIMESRGNENLTKNGVNIGNKQVSSTLIYGPNYYYEKYSSTHFVRNLARGYDKSFHRFQLEWTPDKITFLVDNIELGTVSPPNGFWNYDGLNETNLNNPWTSGAKMAPFDQEMYIILNLAVGGTNGYFPDDATNENQKPWRTGAWNAYTSFWEARNSWKPTWNTNGFNSDFVIDYVRVWAV